MTKQEAIEKLAKGRSEAYAEWKAKKIPAGIHKWRWSYIRTNRRDLMDAYILVHPKHQTCQRILRVRREELGLKANVSDAVVLEKYPTKRKAAAGGR